jgi:branched-chain amino acid transport system ATP-binding protein
MTPTGHQSSVASAGEWASLATAGVAVHFDGVRALDGVDLELESRSILGLIGPNGAGKTTFINVVSGFQRPTAGSVALEGRDVTGLAPNRLAQAGVARTFQGARLFQWLSALENVEAGALGRGLGRRAAAAAARELLAMVGLERRARQRAGSLPYGDQRRLGIVRALATEPRFLLLDEPAAGLTEAESDELAQFIVEVKDRFGCGILVVEHDMRLIMSLCERIHVLDYGRTLAIGTPREVRSDPAVVEAYLGTAVGAGDA